MLLRIIHSLFFYLMTGMGLIIGIIITLVFIPFSKPTTKLFQTAAHLWARFLAVFSGIRVKVSGLENIPRDRAVLFVSNHQSYADDLITLAYIPINFRFLIAKEYFKLPVFGWGFRKAGYFSVDRKSALNAFRTIEKIVEIIKAGESVLIFPEGTRTKTGELGKFKRGSLMAALKSKAPIVPIAISGSFNVLPPGTWIIHPRPVKFTFGKPIYIRSEAEYDKKLEEVRETIAKMM